MITKRLWIMGLVLALALASYYTLLHYSPRLIAFVVEESLVRKAPARTDPALIRARFRAVVESAPDNQTRLETLLAMSQQLEKVQKLNELQLEQLLRKGTGYPPVR